MDLNHRLGAYEAHDDAQLLNTLSVTEIAELSKLSKAYISQVKRGVRTPSGKLLKILFSYERGTRTEVDYFNLFIMSRQSMEISPGTAQFYRIKLGRFSQRLMLTPLRDRILSYFCYSSIILVTATPTTELLRLSITG